MKTTDFLDAVKARRGLRSDYALAKFLGWRTQRISQYRHTQRELDDDACLQIAQALELPPAYVMAELAAERAKSDAARNAWRAAAKLLKRGAAVVLLSSVAGFGGLVQSPSASAGEPVQPASGQSIHYAQRRRRPGDRRHRPERRRFPVQCARV